MEALHFSSILVFVNDCKQVLNHLTFFALHLLGMTALYSEILGELGGEC